MTSQINPNNINGNYPVAGQDNNSQGFRDNFTNTGTNFQYAANEITDLQNKVIVNSQLNGGANIISQNNMLGAPLSNALISNFAVKTVQQGTLSGTVTIDYSAGSFQTVTTSAPITLGFTNWPAAGKYGEITVQITVSNTAHTVTFPTAVSVNNRGIVGLNSNVITFAVAGVYSFTFSTSNGGTTITLNQSNELLQPFNASREGINTGAVSLATTATYVSVAGNVSLSGGVPGQIKVVAAVGNLTGNGNVTLSVTNSAWKAGNVGNAIFGAGQGVTLLHAGNNWYCIGNNGATFS
jgi:hypothetical protein